MCVRRWKGSVSTVAKVCVMACEEVQLSLFERPSLIQLVTPLNSTLIMLFGALSFEYVYNQGIKLLCLVS